jgi:hypothetical protein
VKVRLYLALVIAAVPSVVGAEPDPMPTEETFGELPPLPNARVVSAPLIREVSMGAARPQLPAEPPPPPPSKLADLRKLVGSRPKDIRDPALLALAWARALHGIAIDANSGPRLVAWARKAQRLGAPGTAGPGDLLVFDRTEGDHADLVGLVVERDPRGVLEFVYLGGEVIRRGFVDPARPSMARDGVGAAVNTFLRHGRRHPPKGTRYLAGELVSHAIRM